MLQVKFSYKDIFISSIGKEDIFIIETWIREQVENTDAAEGIDINEFKNRFVEYYASRDEIFLKFLRDDRIVGILKGRIENGALLIWCYIIDSAIRKKGVGSVILDEIMNYFKETYGILTYLTGVVQGNTKSVEFWNKNRFTLERVAKSFFKGMDGEKDMLILKRNL